MSADPRIGTELSGYRIEALLGRGGMSVVYLAEDLALQRKVALKLLSPELAEDERFRERFLRESRLAASIDHPNIVPIYEAGEAQGILYIAMRYVEGTDLKALLHDEGALSPARALVLASQVADALDTAHERGLVHRDVKPSNVLIASRAEREHCYLGDFGLTKSAQDRSGLTVSGQVIGTIDYVAPEQIKGEPMDGRTDVYALGCLLFESLCGEPPFRRESEVATLYAHLEEEPPRVSERRPELPGSLDVVLSKAMAKEPDERYATCEELVAAAQRELGLSGELAFVAPPPRRRRLLLLAFLVAILVAAGAAAGLVVAFTGGSEETETGDRLLRIDPAANEVVESIPVGELPSSVDVGAGHVWVTSIGDGTLTRIDPDTGEMVTAETNGGHAVAVAGSIAYLPTPSASAGSTRGASSRRIRSKRLGRRRSRAEMKASGSHRGPTSSG